MSVGFDLRFPACAIPRAAQRRNRGAWQRHDRGLPAASCSDGHIGPLRPREGQPWAVLKGRGHSVRLQAGGFGPTKTGPASKRGRVRSWSRKSRYRLMERVSAALFQAARYGLVSLTYPKAYEGDPLVFKAHLKAFRKRWERRWGAAQAVWVMEFQRRGAVHFHLVIELTHIEDADLQAWAAQAWYEVVGSEDPQHLIHGAHTQEAWSPIGARRYLMAELSKYKQKQLPTGMEAAGRWWGLWRTEKREVELPLTWDEFYRVRRVLRRLGAKVGYRPRTSHVSGMMLFDDGVGWGLFVALGLWGKRGTGAPTRVGPHSPAFSRRRLRVYEVGASHRQS